MECQYCRWKDGRHDSACPLLAKNQVVSQGELFAGDNLRKTIAIYERGYCDGRCGRRSAENNPVYMLGWGRGDCALEEYENGHDDRFDNE